MRDVSIAGSAELLWGPDAQPSPTVSDEFTKATIADWDAKGPTR
jgi:hypothetical protein